MLSCAYIDKKKIEKINRNMQFIVSTICNANESNDTTFWFKKVKY